MTHFKIKVRHIHLEVFPPDCGESQLKEAKNREVSNNCGGGKGKENNNLPCLKAPPVRGLNGPHKCTG